MLENIQSLYFIKTLFSHLNEEIKLKIAKYNKILQNKIDINLINYQLFSGRYIVFVTNEKVKEYDNFNNKLVYEGGYLNGKRNGKGKEYYKFDGKLKFKGEYLNGKRNGKGKEYNSNGELVFEGEYLNGKKWKR